MKNVRERMFLHLHDLGMLLIYNYFMHFYAHFLYSDINETISKEISINTDGLALRYNIAIKKIPKIKIQIYFATNKRNCNCKKIMHRMKIYRT